MGRSRNLPCGIDCNDPQVADLMNEFEKVFVRLNFRRAQLTLLHKAVMCNNAKMVKQLIEHGADVSVECSYGFTPLYDVNFKWRRNSDETETLEIVQMIVDQDVLLKTSSYCNALKFGSKEMVRAILQSNINLLGRDDDGKSPIHYLAANKTAGVIEQLHGKIFDVNILDYRGQSPLHLATFAALPSTVEFLLNNGANPNSTDRSFNAPLFVAFSSLQHRRSVTKCLDVIELLLKYGADSQLKIKEGSSHNTVFDYCFLKTILRDRMLVLLESLIAYLALNEKKGTIINNHIISLINSSYSSCEFLQFCRQQLITLENIQIDDSLSLYQLLIISDLKVEHCTRNPDIMLQIKSIFKNNTNSYRPYGLKIRKRFDKAVEIIKLRQKAALAFCQLTQLNYNASYLFVDQIIGYLSSIDLQRLCDI